MRLFGVSVKGRWELVGRWASGALSRAGRLGEVVAEFRYDGTTRLWVCARCVLWRGTALGQHRGAESIECHSLWLDKYSRHFSQGGFESILRITERVHFASLCLSLGPPKSRIHVHARYAKNRKWKKKQIVSGKSCNQTTYDKTIISPCDHPDCAHVGSIYLSIAICSFLRLSVSLLSFLKNALLPPLSSLFLLLLRSMYAMVLPPDSSLSRPLVRRPPRRFAL